jgi:hypothetical protein
LPNIVGLIGVIRILEEFCFFVLIEVLPIVLKTEFWKCLAFSLSGDAG